MIFKVDFKSWFSINDYRKSSSNEASIVVSLNRTRKSKMWKQFSLQENYKQIDILSNNFAKFNNTIHRTTRMKAKNVEEKHVKFIFEMRIHI